MKKYMHFRDFISVLMLFVFIIEFSGCTATKIVASNSEIPVFAENCYIIHSLSSKYYIENVSIADGILSGKINKNRNSCKRDKIHIFVTSPSAIIINKDNVLSFSLNDISKVEIVKFSAPKTVLLTFSIDIVLIILILFVHTVMIDY